MNEANFEGTMVLEKMAEINRLSDFMDAVDSDDFARAKQIMKQAQIDAGTIAIVLRKMQTGDD